MKWKWRLFWLTGLGLLWLFCSGIAAAAPLSERLSQYPNWPTKPIAQPAQGDLVYPDWFAGTWQVTTTLTDQVAPLAPEVVTPGFDSNRQFLNRPIPFTARFISTQPTSLLTRFRKQSQQSQWVADRAYNGLQLAQAYLGDRAVLAVKVDPQNPNRQITLLRGNAAGEPLQQRQLVSTVTDRATEAPTSDRFITAEIFRQEFRGAPQLYFNEVENLTAYQQMQETSGEIWILADQITAIYLSPQDPDYFKTAINKPLPQPRPVALYRYRMEFHRPETRSP